MLKDKLLYISKKLIAAAVIVVLTAVIIILASRRILPFMAEDEQEYSIVAPSEATSESEASENESLPDVSGDDKPLPPDESQDVFDENALKLEHVASATPSYDIYDPETHTLVVVDAFSSENFSGSIEKIQMGFVFAECDGVTQIYSPDGNEISSLLDGFTLTTIRDKHGEPLFTDQNGNYFFFNQDGQISPSDYDPLEDYRAFSCETPRYLGVQNSEIYRYSLDGKYGFRTSKYAVVYPLFREAFAFCDYGVCCVIQRYGRTDNLVFYNTKSVIVSMEYYPPAERDESALGYFYFDDGLTRVKTARYEECIMDYDGKLISLPADYTVVSYTDSRILLSKDGRYGFMTSRLEWISLPEYTDARPFYEGLAVVSDATGKYGVIDRFGNEVVPFIFESVSNCSDGLLMAKASNGDVVVFAKQLR